MGQKIKCPQFMRITLPHPPVFKDSTRIPLFSVAPNLPRLLHHNPLVVLLLPLLQHPERELHEAHASLLLDLKREKKQLIQQFQLPQRRAEKLTVKVIDQHITSHI